MDASLPPLNQDFDHDAIEQKVVSILKFTKNYAHAAAKRSEEDKVASLIQFAEYFAENKNFESALFQLKLAYRTQPDDPRIPSIESKIRAMIAKENLAASQKEIFSSLTEKDGGNVQERLQQVHALLTEVEIFFTEEKYIEASELLEKAFAIDPLNEELYVLNEKLLAQITTQQTPLWSLLRKAQAQRKKYNFSEALKFIKEAYALDPLNDSIGELEEQIVNETDEIDHSVQAHVFTARKYIAVRHFKEARQELYTAYLISPLDKKVYAVEKQLKDIEIAVAKTMQSTA